MADREFHEREVIRDPGPGDGRSGVGLGMIIGLLVVIAILVVGAILIFGGDDDDGDGGDGPEITLPEEINIDGGNEGEGETTG